ATTVDLPAGTAVIFTATGTVTASATGTLDNTATVAPPSGTTDPVGTNNSAEDMTTIVTQADVQIAKSGPTNVTAGTSVAFTITVENTGRRDGCAGAGGEHAPGRVDVVPAHGPAWRAVIVTVASMAVTS